MATMIHKGVLSLYKQYYKHNVPATPMDRHFMEDISESVHIKDNIIRILQDQIDHVALLNADLERQIVELSANDQ